MQFCFVNDTFNNEAEENEKEALYSSENRER